jgi:hypothetical protein
MTHDLIDMTLAEHRALMALVSQAHSMANRYAVEGSVRHADWERLSELLDDWQVEARSSASR